MLSQIDSKVPLNGVVVPQSLFTKMIIQKDQSARKKALNTTSPLGSCEKATFLKEKYGTKLSTPNHAKQNLSTHHTPMIAQYRRIQSNHQGCREIPCSMNHSFPLSPCRISGHVRAAISPSTLPGQSRSATPMVQASTLEQ